MTQYGYRSSPNVKFVVKSNTTKQLRIFNYPITPGSTRDLMKIPNIGEEDIRVSCLKGQLRGMIDTGRISIVESDIDLLQFNSDQKQYLENAGAVPSIDPYSVTDIKTSAYSATLGDLVRCNASGGGFTVTLPSAVNHTGRGVTIKNVTSSTNSITVGTTLAQTIDTASTYVINTAFQSATFVSDGTNWMAFPAA